MYWCGLWNPCRIHPICIYFFCHKRQMPNRLVVDRPCFQRMKTNWPWLLLHWGDTWLDTRRGICFRILFKCLLMTIFVRRFPPLLTLCSTVGALRLAVMHIFRQRRTTAFMLWCQEPYSPMLSCMGPWAKANLLNLVGSVMGCWRQWNLCSLPLNWSRRRNVRHVLLLQSL